jgi:hypothetical protein
MDWSWPAGVGALTGSCCMFAILLIAFLILIIVGQNR